MTSIHDYRDIIDLPHPDPQNHTRMPVSERAAQFMPFAALTGYSSVISEISRSTEDRKSLDESEKARLNRMLSLLKADLISKVRIVYFEADRKKEGGRYLTVSAKIREVDEYRRTLTTEDGLEISFEDILSIDD